MGSSAARVIAAVAIALGVNGMAWATPITNINPVDDFLIDQPATSTYFAGTEPLTERQWNDPFSTGYRRQLVLSNGISDGAVGFPASNSILQYSNAIAAFSAFDVFYFDLSRESTALPFFELSVRSVAGLTYTLGFDTVDLNALPATPGRLHLSFLDFDDLALLGGNPPINWEEINLLSFSARNLTMHEWGVANFETLAVIPVPPTAALMLIGLAGLGLHRKRMAAKQ